MTFFEYLDKLELSGIKLGLENSRELYNLSMADKKKLKFIHIAGTNGKGSTAIMVAKALEEVGFKVGFYSSPHLMKFNERIRINGTAISDAELETEYQKLKVYADLMSAKEKFVTYFEFTTMLAINYFANKDVDFVVLETGLGGRYDSTNVVDSLISVITNISLDHQQFLGDTIAKIAYEKGGIIKDNQTVFCGVMEQEALELIYDIAKEKNCNLIDTKCNLDELDFNYTSDYQEFVIEENKIQLSLLGKMQRENAHLVYNILKYLSTEFNFYLEQSLSALKNVKWAGRCQKVGNIIIDGAHNQDGAKSLIATLLEAYPNYKYNFVFSSFKDKDSLEVLQLLDSVANEFCFKKLEYSFRNSYDDNELLDILRGFSDKKVEKFENWDNIIDSDKNNNIYVVCGSLYLVGEFLEYINFDINKI